MSNEEKLVDAATVADYLGVSYRTLYNWRKAGTGPTWRRVGRLYRYDWDDVQRFNHAGPWDRAECA